MALRRFSGFEISNGEATLSGTASINTGTVRTGGGSLRVNPTTTGVGHALFYDLSTTGTNSAAFNIATSYVQFWFRYATKPASNNEQLYVTQDTGGSTKLSLRLNSTGTIGVYGAADTLLGTSSTTLSANTWYKIEIQTGTSATVGAYELKINGSSEVSGTANLSASNAQDFRLGKITNKNSQTVDFFYDDFAVSDSAFFSGDVAVKAMNVNADGSTMSWSGGTAPSNYTTVDDGHTVNDTDYVQSPTSGNPNVALFNLESCATVGISGTILGFQGLTRTRENTSVTSATLIRVRSSSTNSDSATRNGSTSVTVSMRLLENDPSTGSAWTTSGLDAVEVGAVENNAVAVRCTHVRGFVLYVPPSSPTKNLTLLGVG